METIFWVPIPVNQYDTSSEYVSGKTADQPEDFSILAKSSCNFKPEIQESIFIKLLKPTLTKTSPQYHYICFDIDSVNIYTLFRE